MSTQNFRRFPGQNPQSSIFQNTVQDRKKVFRTSGISKTCGPTVQVMFYNNTVK